MPKYNDAVLHALAQIPDEGIPLSQLPEDGVAQMLQEHRLAYIICDPDGGRLQLTHQGRKALASDVADTAVLEVPHDEVLEDATASSSDDLLVDDAVAADAADAADDPLIGDDE